ncbi:MAG: site-specific integrase [Candidatus Sericytochromatia bacterium]|nr:site-specific integrase [Candidatus Sericytochromatia bacterium]
MSKIDFLPTVSIPDYFHKNEMNFKVLKNFPFMKDKNGNPVTPVNMYLSSHLNTNLSANTIKRTVFCLKILIDYCEIQKLKLSNFLEDDLLNLSKSLQVEKDANGAVRNNTTVNNIIYQIIKFFDFFGKTFLNDDDYVKNVLNVEDRTVSSKGQIKNVKKHKAMVLNAEKTTRNPINLQDIDLIYQNIDKLYVSKFAQERTKVLIKLLEHTGARLGEIALIQISDITDAINSPKGLLRLATLKRRRESSRFVPVDKQILNQINSFIKIYRNKIIRKTVKDKDLNFLFISEHSGEKINSSSLSNDFTRLRSMLKIKSSLCAHMFRHRFITNIFINLIKQYDFDNKDSFRNALLDVNTLKAHVQQLTGHKDINSLDTYLHLAKSELANMPEILKKLDEQRDIESREALERYLLNELKSGNISTEQYIQDLEKLKK